MLNLIMKAAAVVVVSAGAADVKVRPLATQAQPVAQTVGQAPLDAREVTALSGALKGAEKGSVTVACAGPWCRDLAGGLAKTFAGAGWTVHRIDHGGIGIDGVSGIRVNYCGVSGQKVRDVLDHTTRQVEAVQDTACNALVAREVYVIIGAPSIK